MIGEGFEADGLIAEICAAAAGALYWLMVLPDGPSRMRLAAYFCLPCSTFELPEIDAAIARAFDEFMAVNDGDMAICAAVQRGQSSRLAAPGRLSRLEEPIWQFISYLAGRLDDGR